MVSLFPRRDRHGVDASAARHDGERQDATGLLGLFGDLRVLLAIMLGHDMAPPIDPRRSAAAGRLTAAQMLDDPAPKRPKPLLRSSGPVGPTA